MTEQDKVTVDEIIGIVKTDGQTNSVQLKKEAQLSICEKRLIELEKENEQLKSDKEHLMGCLIRFFGYDDEDIDYNLNRESNRDFGKQYYSMKEETKKELEE